MGRPMVVLTALVLVPRLCYPQAPAESPLQPLEPDGHTLLLYHLDEGEGLLARDSSGHGYDGELRGPEWTTGKFGKALRFDGRDDSVFRATPEAIQGVKAITVECWFSQDDPAGRQFLVGQDVGFHFDLTNGTSTSLSIYNRGGREPNADGLPHQHLGTSLGSPRVGKWHHNATTYDGRYISFFFDGVLRARLEAAREFSLGAPSRGLWIGCYVGDDFWYSGRVDEVRVSDCIRYDPECKLKVGERVFDVPRKTGPAKAVRRPQKTGMARLEVTLRKLYGDNAAGWVYLKAPGQRAAIVGQYELKDMQDGSETRVEVDVSDELGADGTYILGLEPSDSGAYFAVTAARMTAQNGTVAEWVGHAASRRTFEPPVLVPLAVGPKAKAGPPSRIVLLPADTDRVGGELEIDDEEPAGPAVLFGEGYVEYWLNLARETTYRLHLRYAAAAQRPCDIVMDGQDLNAYDMCAANATPGSRPQDALWEYQGTVTLGPGLHWLRLQDVLPDIGALRLEPAPPPKPVSVPWARYSVPPGGFLAKAEVWQAEPQFGTLAGPEVRPDTASGQPALRFATSFENTDATDLHAGDCVRFTHRGKWDLEPFGRLSFAFEGQGSGHVVALWLVDVKGDEKLLWRVRDTEAGVREVAAPVSFEGNDVFDPGHVVAVCIDLDEANVRPEEVNRFSASIINPHLQRRDEIVLPDTYAQSLVEARQALAGILPTLPRDTEPLRSAGFRPWTEPVVPEKHPLFATAEPKPVTRATMGAELHFTGARGIVPQALDDFHKFHNFGDVCWPHIGMLPLRKDHPDDASYQGALQELEARLEDVRDRGLYLFDIWGYVPHKPDFPWTVAPEHHGILTRVLGDRFLGYDNGEQDGRYIGSYADKGPHTNRREGWDDFVKWDEQICADSMDYMNVTGSLNFSHYYGERGARTLGLETAQGLPSDTLMFAFLRGAGKQYGRLTTQATSVWNRFGWNVYANRKTTGGNGYGFGPNKGCSLGLHKCLFFSSYLGGDSIAGTETSQFTADRLPDGSPELSPLGRQHLAIKDWVEQHPDRGVMYTPVAFMLDFYNGWNMPRHLYRGDKYKVWGKLPYEKGDYLTDGMFRLVWPGYEDCSYLRNERGFITPTPYGDIFDVITNRCHPDILKQYSAIMLLGDVEMTPEVVANLTGFVEAGGDLITDSRHVRALPESLTGLKAGPEGHGCTSHDLSSGKTYEELPYTYTVLSPDGASALLVNEYGHPLVTANQSGNGRVVVGAADYWMTDELTYRNPEIVNMEPPYALLQGVRAVLGEYFGSFSPVGIEPGGLNIRTCCYADDPKRLLVGLMNNDLFADWEGSLEVRIGDVASAHELWHDERLPARGPIKLTIRAGDVAVVDVRLR